jgi:site-specific DNA-methyltransferase (adenine-specific)
MPADNYTAPVLILISDLHDHPQNPRSVLDEETLAGIQAGLGNGFNAAHSLIVRPNGDGYQILAGHHRKEAANREGIAELPCWIREIGDDEAHMLLVTSNAQTPPSALAIGKHAMQSGMRANAYAEMVGKGRKSIEEYMKAAQVAETAKKEPGLLFDDKFKHLYQISKAHQSLWPMLVDEMLTKEWSKDDTIHWITKIREFKIDDAWADVFPLKDVVAKFLHGKEFAPQTLKKIINQCQAIIDLINDFDVDREQYTQEFRTFAGENWDYRKILQRFNELQQELSEDVSDSNYHHGTFKDFIDEIEDDSVSVLLTDPPYGMDYQSDYKLDRRKERGNARIEKDDHEAMDLIDSCTDLFYDKLKDDAHVFVFINWKNEGEVIDILRAQNYTVRGSLIWEKNNTGMGDPNTTFAPKHERIIHAVKGSPILYEREADVLHYDRCDSTRHPTEKPVELLKRLLSITAVAGELIADPFAGVASTLVAAKELNMVYWGCEVADKYHDAGRVRLHG